METPLLQNAPDALADAEKQRRIMRSANDLSTSTHLPAAPLDLASHNDDHPPVPTTAVPPESGNLPTANASSLFDDATLDLDAIENLLDGFRDSSDPSLGALTPSLFTSRSSNTITNRTVPASCPFTSTDADAATGIQDLPTRQVSAEDASLPRPLDTSGIAFVAQGESDPLEVSSHARKGNVKGWLTSMHIAAQEGHEQILRVLLQHDNIDPNVTDSDRRTPLFYATIKNHISVIQLLLSHRALFSILNYDGRSALHWAILYQQLEAWHLSVSTMSIMYP